MTELGMDSAQLLAAMLHSGNPEQDELLDAARDAFVKHGFRKTSPEDIARRAKISRATLYRKMGDKDAIVTAVVVREALRFFESIQEQVLPLESASDRVVESFVLGIRTCRTHPLVQAILELEPEAYMAQLTTINRPPATLVRDMVAGVLADEAAPLERMQPVADLLIRITGTLLLAPSDVTPLDTDQQAREFAQTYFAPMVEAAST